MVNDFIYVKPEEEGISSKHIVKFIDFIEEYKINLHSFMMVRRGKIVAEGYYPPFHKGFAHRLYSSSKTFVAMAIGKLIEEGKVKLDDKLVDFFPELLEREQDQYMQECTIENALTMSVPMLTDSYFKPREKMSDPLTYYKDWTWTFFNCHKSLKPAGTIFNYNTSGTFLLSVLVEKLTGKTFLKYLRPVFDKIGVGKDIWCVESPDGYAWGGSGVVCTTQDFAKFAELIMYKGNYKGEQILPRDYMELATSKRVYCVTANDYTLKKASGYGYQIWIQKTGFALLGMGCQVAFCFPDKEFLFVCTGDTQSTTDDCDADKVYSFVKELVYERIQETALEENAQDYMKLQNKLNSLHLPLGFGEKGSRYIEEYNGVKYILNSNPMGWKWLQFDFSGEGGVLTYENERGVKKLPFGFETYIQSTFPETHYYGAKVDTPANREFDCLCTASWVEDRKILLRVYVIDTSLGNCFMTFGFKKDQIGVYMSKKAEFFMDEYNGYACGISAK